MHGSEKHKFYLHLMTQHFLSIDIGTKNYAYTIITLFCGALTDTDFHIIQLPKDIKGEYDILHETLTKLTPIDGVIIERQVNRAGRNMRLMTLTYAICCNIVGSENVFLFNPLDKFKVLNLPYDTKNKHHKKQSVQYAQRILQTHPLLLERFKSFRKKDDLADTLNQALTFLSTRGYLDKVQLRNTYLSL